MVFVNTARLSAAAALSIALSVSALPAAPSENMHKTVGSVEPTAHARRDGPTVVQARSLEPKMKRGYVGGGSGKRLRQAPMMKPARMVKAKRSLDARDNVHVHEHIHDHGDGHYDNYDPNHSEHWNYHHNRVGNRARDLLHLEVLNIGSHNGGKKTIYTGHNNQVNTGHNNNFSNVKNNKRAVSGEKKSTKKPSTSSDGEHAKTSVHKKTEATKAKPKSGSKDDGKHQHKGVKRHDSHSYSYWHDNAEHDHDHEHVHAHIHRRDHDGHSDHWYEHHGLDSHSHDHDHGHEHVHIHDRRDMTPSGTPGFVEVASTFFHSNLAKSVAGLVYSKDSSSNSSDFALGTSDTQSTEFYLVPYTGQHSDKLGSMMDPNASAAAYQLRVPVLDSQHQTTSDYCATFDITPPSPLSMAPCGDLDGFSQMFGYNATTGELTPIYPPTSSQPMPMNAAVHLGSPQMLAADISSLGNNTLPMPDNSNLTSAMLASTSMPAPTPTATSLPTDPSSSSKVALYFIPSSSFYTDASADSMSQSSEATSTAGAAVASATVFNPAGAAAIKAVQHDQDSADDDSDDEEYTTVTITTTMSADDAAPTVFDPASEGAIRAVSFDGDSAEDDSDDDYYTTVTVTTTVSANDAGPTDGPVYDTSSAGRNNAVIADTDGSDMDNTGDDSASDAMAADSSDM